ncbi:DUF2785 domain-containing protein [Streptomyces sp. NPDC051567]|uniref:DUF2785 domain-containing protein n=1 Tax=Streptomyces sp. NPDC051567 TaxID=3365660 RepID=UPI0037A965EF
MTKIDIRTWQAVHAADFAVPPTPGLTVLVDELAAALRDPDPEIRDGYPYVVLRTWIRRDVIGAELRAGLGAVMTSRFGDAEIQARTFAPLVLEMIVSQGDFDPDWLAAFSRWYPAETDLRGHDPVLGWLHAGAHGADLLGAFGCHPDVRPAQMLGLAAARLLAPTDHVFAEQEDDRLANAVSRVLLRPDLSEADAVAWLAPVEADFAATPSGPAPAHTSNCMRTLRALYVLADLGVRLGEDSARTPLPHREAVKRRLAEVLSLVKHG